MSLSEQYKEDIEKYYKLKEKYEKKYLKNVFGVLEMKNEDDSNVSLDVKKENFLKIRMKCVNCNKDGGTIFTNNDKIMSAVCNAEPRCNLNLIIEKQKYYQTDDIYNKLKERRENIKSSIIETKMLNILGFLDEDKVVNMFDKLKKQYDEINKYCLEMDNILIEKTTNLEKKNEIKEQNIVIYNLLNNFNKLLRDYEDTQNEGLLKEAVELYVYEIQEELEKLRDLKYYNNEVLYDKKNEISYLIQEPYNLTSLETNVKKEIITKLNKSNISTLDI